MYNTSSNFSVSSFRSRSLACLLLVIFSLSFIPSTSLAQQPTATISALSGMVLVNGQEAGEGTVMSAGDVIETQAGASVVLELSDGSQLELNENTKIDIIELSQTATGAWVSKVKMAGGWFRAKLTSDQQKEDSTFDIETPNALLQAKFLEADLEVSYDSDQQETVGLVRIGVLSAKNLMTNEEVIVPVGSAVIITSTTTKIIAGYIGLGKSGSEITETEMSKSQITEPGKTGTETAEVDTTETEAAKTGTAGAKTATGIGGLSTKTIAFIGLGVAGAAGGIAIITRDSDDGGNSEGSGSGANDSFTGTFVAQNPNPDIERISFELFQTGSLINGTCYQEDVYGYQCTWTVTGTVNGLSANLTLYEGQCYDPEYGEWLSADSESITATLINDGSILRVTDPEVGQVDFIRQ